MSHSYEDLKPYWEAWKNNSVEPADPEEAARFKQMNAILRAVAGQDASSADQSAVQYILLSLPRWRSELTQHPNWNPNLQTLKLYRGLRDEAAIDLRLELKRTSNFQAKAGEPLCYSVNEGVAKAFARKGHCDGAVYSVEVPLSEILFSDLEGHTGDPIVDKEEEIVVLHGTPLNVTPQNVDSRIPTMQNRPFRNPKSKEEWNREKARLVELDQKLLGEK